MRAATGRLVLRSAGAKKFDGLNLRWPFGVGSTVTPSRAGLRIGIRPCLATVTALVVSNYTYSGDLRLILIQRPGSKTECSYHVSFWLNAT